MLSERLYVSRERIQLYWNGCLLQDLHAMFTQPGMPSDVELSCVIAAWSVEQLEAELRYRYGEFEREFVRMRGEAVTMIVRNRQLEKDLAALQAEVMALRQQLATCPGTDI